MPNSLGPEVSGSRPVLVTFEQFKVGHLLIWYNKFLSILNTIIFSDNYYSQRSFFPGLFPIYIQG